VEWSGALRAAHLDPENNQRPLEDARPRELLDAMNPARRILGQMCAGPPAGENLSTNVRKRIALKHFGNFVALVKISG
jgi:hypothetical protein